MSTADNFDQFYLKNKTFFNLFEDMPIKGIIKSIWQKQSLKNEQDQINLNQIIEKLYKENQELSVLKGEAETKIELRNDQIKRKTQINASIIEQQKFFTEEIEELKNKKDIALTAANHATQKVEKIVQKKKLFQDKISALNLHIVKQDQEIENLNAERQGLKAQLDKLLYEKEELSSYAKNYKQLNNKLSNEVFRLSQSHTI